jgi:DNA repair protein RecO (recombination protein O)
MVRKDVGVILKSARSGETSKVVTFLGRQSGKISLIAKGALGPKSPFRGLLELGNLIDVVFYYKDGRTLFFVKEVSVVSTLGSVRDSLPHLAAALGALELVESVCYWGSPDARAVDLIADYISCAPAKDPRHAYLAFEFKLLEVLGQNPDLSTCAACGSDVAGGSYHPSEGTSLCRTHDRVSPHCIRLDPALLAHAARVAGCTLAEACAFEVERAVRKRFGEILHWTYTFHIQGYSLPTALTLLPKNR